MGRIVVIGRNAEVWRRLSAFKQLESAHAISYRDINALQLEEDDCVWIMSYSRDHSENIQLFKALHHRCTHSVHIVYVSTATANVAEVTSCYKYPRAKSEAEAEASKILDAIIIRIGLVYENSSELPAGQTAATPLAHLAELMAGAAPKRTGQPIACYQMIMCPFRSDIEASLYSIYGRLMHLTGSWPCLLRPLDLGLKLARMRWYGYLFLSNKLLATKSGSLSD